MHFYNAVIKITNEWLYPPHEGLFVFFLITQWCAFIGSGRTDTRAKLETLESAMVKKEIPAMKWRMQAVMVLV